MKSPLVQSTTKSARDLAKTVAKQIAQEPVEMLKTAREQAFGAESPPPKSYPGTRPGSGPK